MAMVCFFFVSRDRFRVHPHAHIGPAFPSFSFQPNPFFTSDGSVDPDSHNFSRYSDSPPPPKSVGLLEPKNSNFHHGLVPSLGLLLVLVG